MQTWPKRDALQCFWNGWALLTLIFLLETREWLLEKGRIRSVAGWTQTGSLCHSSDSVWSFSFIVCNALDTKLDNVWCLSMSEFTLLHVKWWFVRCVCVCVREREKRKGWIEEFHWIEWMPFLWPLNKMTYFTDRTLFFCRECACPLPVFFLSLFQDIVSLYVSRLLSLCI